MNDKTERYEILEQYVTETDPRKRRELLLRWVDAGGRQLIDDAAHAGLASLRTGDDNGDG